MNNYEYVLIIIDTLFQLIIVYFSSIKTIWKERGSAINIVQKPHIHHL